MISHAPDESAPAQEAPILSTERGGQGESDAIAYEGELVSQPSNPARIATFVIAFFTVASVSGVLILILLAQVGREEDKPGKGISQGTNAQKAVPAFSSGLTKGQSRDRQRPNDNRAPSARGNTAPAQRSVEQIDTANPLPQVPAVPAPLTTEDVTRMVGDSSPPNLSGPQPPKSVRGQATAPAPEPTPADAPVPPTVVSRKARAGEPRKPPSVSQAPVQAPTTKLAKNDDDLPDVSLQIPEETRPEVKAIIKAQVLGLQSRQASERIKAAEILGELGEQGKPVRGLLCRTLLDASPQVRVVAADSLKKIDPKMQYLAVTFMSSAGPRGDLLQDGLGKQLLASILKLEEDGEPLAPLIANSAMLHVTVSGYNALDLLQAELSVLSHISRNNPYACRLIASAMGNPNEGVRNAAVESLARMKHARQYVSSLIGLLKTDTSTPNRIAAIATLVALADESTEEAVTEAISSQRYHPSENVRKAVDLALNKLQNRATDAPKQPEPSAERKP